MKKTKMEKGITLVALIITIVVLLILAAVAIAAIQNENILSHANNAAVKYNGSVDNEQGILGGYLDVLDKYTGNEWITIYEGNATTQDGTAVLGETDLFAYGGVLGVTYKITVSSDEFSGTVETVPILVALEGEMNGYYLFAVENGEAIGFTSMEDVDNKLDNLGENATMVAGISQVGMCGIMLDGATCEYTITKIERKSLEPIFKGEVALLSSNEGIIISQLEGVLKLSRNYIFEVEINGEIQNIDVKHFNFLGDSAMAGYFKEEIILLIGVEESSIVSVTDMILKAIYDVGPSSDYVEENGFGAYYLANSDSWTLNKTPDTSYVVPETVAGKTINRVIMSGISGEPTFTKDIYIFTEVALRRKKH